MAFIEPMHRNKPNITYLPMIYAMIELQVFMHLLANIALQ